MLNARNPKGSALDVLTHVPLMAYRGSGVTGTYVPVQGNLAGTAGDVLSYGRGTQISGNNYQTANTNQGTRGILYEPLHAGNDGKYHTVWQGGGCYNLEKSSSNRLGIVPKSTGLTEYARSDVSWALLARQLAIGRYDSDNVVTGSSYLDFTLNGVQSVGTTAAFTAIAPDANAFIGSNNGLYAGHLLYAAWDLDYVQSAAEIAALGTGTAPVSPDRVILHPEGIKFLWLPGARAASGSFTGSLTNEACSWDWLAYNSSTNPNGTLVVNGRFEAALGAEWFAAMSNLTRKTDAASLAGAFDTAVLEVSTNEDTSEGFARQTLLGLTAGDNFYVSAWAKKGTSNAAVSVYSAIDGVPVGAALAYLTTTSTSFVKLSACVQILAGHNSLVIDIGTASSGAFGLTSYFDNVGVWFNKVVNGGFEGTFAKTGSALTTSTAATSTVTDLGGGSYRVVDSTAWDLSLAVVGMIAEWHDGSGFLTTVTDAS
ncbi:MAG: hypothetical protein ABFD94_22130, partial [Armatimonadia bacterium]